jgi:microcin C transport system substrate-binding protein
MTFFAAAALAAVTWYPAPDWVDRPDPVASVHARKGGRIRFNGASAPESNNAYIDTSSYTSMMFSMMYLPLISTDSETLEFTPCVAKKWSVSDDWNEYTFVIDERATWSDGRPVSASDVKWTFDAVMDRKSNSGPYKTMLGCFESPEILDSDSERPLKIRFRKKGNTPRNWRDIMHCGTFWILPRHAFEGKDFNKLDFLGAPSGGPYMISKVDDNVETVYSRVKTWWRKDFPSCRHVYNFDEIVLRYYAENENGFFALMKNMIDVYPVYSARLWVQSANGKAYDRNWLLKRRVTNHEPVGYQGFAMNMRNFPFDDVRVRKAMAKLIDRVMMNRTMMYNEYFMQNSFFSDLYDEEHPCRNELLLFDSEGAAKLLKEAGFSKNPETGILEKDGRQFVFRFLTREQNNDKFLVHFKTALENLGIRMHIERKDFTSWMKDMDDFNFQMTWSAMGASIFRNPEIMWLSSEADRKTSGNYTGFKSEEVDRLIAEEKSMMTVAERNAAYREIDRLIAAEHPYAFLWNISAKRLIYWNKFGMPDTVLSRYSNEEAVLSYWWFDPDKDEELREAQKRNAFLPIVPVEVDFDQKFKKAK